MRCGIISDIHGNLEALEAAIDRLGQVDAYICPGDIVGYGANPNECCDLVRRLAQVAVIGNHDAAVLGVLDISWFNLNARAAVAWTSDILSEENRSYLTRLQPTWSSEERIVVHGSLDGPLEFPYIDSPWAAMPSFDAMSEELTVCFIGHTHLAECYTQRRGVLGVDGISMTSGGKIELREGFRYVINCGSVGQPRDGNPAAACGVFDTDARTVEIVRVDYDIPATQRKIKDAGLPEALADRLSLGV
ncbi:MAG: metallophosphoesterase family protein [Armatimonadota bacterium]|nr:metallophosphoesterase family protein [Armatimonadota bacterium]